MAPVDESAAADLAAGATARATTRWSYALLVPAWVLAIWLAATGHDHIWRPGTEQLLAGVAAVAISLAAGIRLGAGLGEQAEPRLPGVTLLPALFAWVAPALPPQAAFVALALLVAAQGAWDSLGAHRGELPQWYGRLRRWQTLWLVAAMLLAFAASS